MLFIIPFEGMSFGDFTQGLVPALKVEKHNRIYQLTQVTLKKIQRMILKKILMD